MTGRHTVALAVTDGTPLFEIAPPCAIFGAGPRDLRAPDYDLRVCAAADTRVGGWLRAETEYGLDAVAGADTVVVPACHDLSLRPPPELVEVLRAAYERGARIASICTGAFALAEAGILDGRRATTHWMHADLLARRYPAVEVDPDVLYVDAGQVLTSAGKAAGIDLCLHLVRSDHGAAVANALARRLVVAPHRAGGQAQFIDAPVPDRRAEDLGDVLAWAQSHLDQPLTVGDLAERAATSTRHLGRRFLAATGTTPLQWLLLRRVHRAQELLEHTDDSVDRVAEQVGMGTAATLRRHFHRVVGVSPAAYRRTFRPGRDDAA